jgi:hypothetical protein
VLPTVRGTTLLKAKGFAKSMVKAYGISGKFGPDSFDSDPNSRFFTDGSAATAG